MVKMMRMMTEQAWDREASDGLFPEPTLPPEWYAPVWNVREEAGSVGSVQAGGRERVLRNLKFHTTEMSTGETEIQERSKMKDQLEKGGGEVQEKKYTHHHHTLAFKFFFRAGADEQQYQPLLIFTCSE